jgi:two-component system response regulator DesR
LCVTWATSIFDEQFRARPAAGSDPLPVIWLVTDGRDRSQVKRLAIALLVDGLPIDQELTVTEVERFAQRSGANQPDVLVIICDLDREDCGILRKLRRMMPRMQTVIVSPIGNPVAIRRALDLGTRGLLEERHVERTLAPAIRAVCAGLLALSPEARSSAAKPVFTHREKEILALVVDGLSNGEIAARLGLSASTIKSHLATAFAKLGVHSRSEAAALILDPDSSLAMTALPLRRRQSFPRARLGW